MTDIYRQRDAKLKKLATDAFAEHVIRKREGERGFLLQRRHLAGGWDQNMAAEIFCGFFNYIYVGGDIDGVVFGHGPHDLRARIAWIGDTDDVSYYVRQKACIGLAKKEGGEVWDPEFAEAEVRDRLARCLEEAEAHGQETHELRAQVEEALEYGAESFDLLYDALTHSLSPENIGFIDDFWEVGQVTAPRVYYSWAAVRKLHHLLLDEEKDSRKNPCPCPHANHPMGATCRAQEAQP